jgi:hypothetical protein
MIPYSRTKDIPVQNKLANFGKTRNVVIINNLYSGNFFICRQRNLPKESPLHYPLAHNNKKNVYILTESYKSQCKRQI